MDNKYQLQSIEKEQSNDVLKQQENARQLQLNRTRQLYSRLYNSNSIRISGYPPEMIVALNYLYKQEIECVKKAELAQLNSAIDNDILIYNINGFNLRNL